MPGLGRLDTAHGALGDLALFAEPVEEATESAVSVRHDCRLVAPCIEVAEGLSQVLRRERWQVGHPLLTGEGAELVYRVEVHAQGLG